MSRLSLNKATLVKQSNQLKRYQQFLPSLDLKRKQLTAERAKIRRNIELTEQQLQQLLQRVQQQLPMLADAAVNIHGLVNVDQLKIKMTNVVGVHLPEIEILSIATVDYSYLSKPHWVDSVTEIQAQVMQLRIHLVVLQHSLTLLDQAVKKVTQRVNLFEKVLIPQARENIRKIRIYLSDAEKVGVVNAKLTKKKRLQQSFQT